MGQETLSLENRSLTRSLHGRWQGIGLQWKITGTFVGVTALLGLVVVVLVKQLMGSALLTELDQRAAAIAANLSDAAAGHLVGKDYLALHALVTKYALLENVAYAIIEDGKGEVVAHSLGAFPVELQGTLSARNGREHQRRVLTFRGKPVYETRIPILEGQAGAARVGIWGDVVEKEVQSTLLPLVGVITVVILAGMFLSLIVARGIIRPIVRLTQIADKISMGDLGTAVDIQSGDEIGALARSLERMRASLKAAMARLGRS